MRKVFLLLVMAIFLLSSCGKKIIPAKSSEGNYSSKSSNPIDVNCGTKLGDGKLKADVIGFNDDVTMSYNDKGRKPYDLLCENQKDEMNDYVLKLQPGSNTAAYYALDLGLDRITEVKKKFMEKDPNSKYYIVLLTDGLDNVSEQLAKNNNRGKYSSIDDYAEKLQKRMNSIMKNNTNVFQSFVLVYKGDDLRKSDYSDDELRKNLSKFKGAQNITDTMEVQVDNDLRKLFDNFKKNLVTASFDFEIPKGYAGKTIRMLLDSIENIYFDVDFNKHKKDSYKLENIKTSNGFNFEKPTGGIIYMDNTKNDKNSKTAHFSIKKLITGNGPYKVNKEKVTQWFKDGKLRINSEYRKEGGSIKNAYVLVILDTSASFTDIDEAKLNIMDIVEFIGNL